MEITNVPFRKLEITVLKKSNNEESCARKPLNTLKYPRSLDDALKHYGCVCWV
jgi:hypothetical protein